MIEFIAESKEVAVKVTTSVGWHITARFNCDSVLYAILLRKELDEKLNRELNRIREEAYQKGWRDAKAKKVKETWFSSWW
jgi:hypothetical protein